MDVVHPSFLSLLFDNVCAYSHVEEFKVVFFCRTSRMSELC